LTLEDYEHILFAIAICYRETWCTVVIAQNIMSGHLVDSSGDQINECFVNALTYNVVNDKISVLVGCSPSFTLLSNSLCNP